MEKNTKENPLISIIMPVYNTEAYLENSIKSVLGQGYENLELIVVDDGSTDSSYKKCKDLERQDKRIKLFHKSNGGAASARNMALDRATGDYIMFVDSDDTLEDNCIDTAVNLIIKHNADVCVFNFDIVEQEGTVIEFGGEHPISDELLTPDEVFNRTYEKNGYMYSLLWNKIIKRNLFDNLRFSKMRMCEDEVIFPRIIIQCSKICTTSRVLYHYLHRNGSIMHEQGLLLKHLDQLRAYYDRVYFYRVNGKMKLAEKAEREYWENVRQHYIKYDLTILENKVELRNVKKQYNSLFMGLMKNNSFSAHEKLHQLVFYISPSIYKKYIQLRSK